jgi:hypothetical protein
MKRYTVNVGSPPAGPLGSGWDYPFDYFPRGFHYKKDAVTCKIRAESKGGRNVEIKKVIDKKVLPKSKAEEFGLYENIYINGNCTLKQPALIGLDPDNRIVKSETRRVRKKESNKYGGAYSSSEDEDEYD